MNPLRLFLATIGGTVAYFAVGFLAFALLPLKSEFRKYPMVYRTEEGVRGVMPMGMLGMFLSVFVLCLLYSGMIRHGAGWVNGVRFGALIGIFALGAFVLHNYVNLQIGAAITAQQAVMYFVEWTVVGLVIGVLYR